MIKAAFFDIDGTLLSFKTHRIPASAQQVLDSFHEQGIACVIATGRPTYQMPDWLFNLGWDAYITLSGQHCFDAEGVYRSCPIDPDDVAVIVDQVAQGRYDSLCMQGENSFVNRLSERVVTAGSNAGIVYHEEPFDHAFDASVYQFCAFVDPADEHIVTDAVSHSLTTRWCDLFCDIILPTAARTWAWQRRWSAWASMRARRSPLATARTTCRCSRPWAQVWPWATRRRP